MSINLKEIQKYIDLAVDGLQEASEELNKEVEKDLPEDDNVVVLVVKK